MRTILLAMAATLLLATPTPAQPLPDREALAKIPLNEAMVLDPVGSWWPGDTKGADLTPCTALDQKAGHPVWTVAAPGRGAPWSRRLGIPVELQRYPVAVIAYRARGIEPSEERCLALTLDKGGSVTVLRNREIVADGEVHELTMDLRDAQPAESIVAVAVNPRCQGPEPAVFELLGLRFESDHALPPLENQDETEFAVRVVDVAGQGLAGATVTLDGEWLNAARSIASDASGHAVLRVANSRSGEHTLSVAKAGMFTIEFSSKWDKTLPETVTLVPGCRYGGKVTNEAGEPVPGAVVEFRLGTRDANGERSLGERLLTGADGSWQSPVLPAETAWCVVTLYHPDYAPSNCRSLPLRALHEDTAVLTIRRGTVLHGTVLRPDGHPLPRAPVMRGTSQNASGFETVRTNAEGGFAFSPWNEARTTVVVETEGFAPAAVDVDCAPGQPALEIRLEPASLVLGRVVDPAGNPLPGTTIKVADWRRANCLSWIASTDADGRFAWCDAPTDTVYFSISRPGSMTLMRHPLAPADEEQQIVLPPPLHLSGTIRDAETGQPILGASLVSGYYHHPQQATASWDRRRSGRCLEGHYELTFDKVYAGLAVMAEADGYTSAASPKLLPGDMEQTLDFALRRAAAIAGIVYLPDGQPAPNARVCLVKEGDYLQFQSGYPVNLSGHASVETGPDGQYRLPAQAGKWLLVASHPLGYAEATSVGYGESPDLKLEAWGRIEGIYRVGARPAVGQTVNVVPRPHGGWNSGFPYAMHSLPGTADEAGRFSVGHVPPGNGNVSIFLRQGSCSIQGRSEFYDLPPGGTVQVNLGGTGQPVAGHIRLLPEDATAVDVGSSEVWLATWLDTPVPRPALPTTWDALPLAERQARFAEWRQGPAGRDYFRGEAQFQHAWQKQGEENLSKWKRYGLMVAEDGSCHGDDIQAGHYQLTVRLFAPRESAEQYRGKLLGVFEFEVTVPEMPGGRSDETLDFGDWTIRGLGRML